MLVGEILEKNRMNVAFANKLCQLFGFGKLLHSPQAVGGGLLHKMWHLDTDSGEFAVKELNPFIMTRENIKEEYELSEKIAHAFKNKGIPAVTSLSYQNNAVIVIENSYFIVYPWVNAKALDKKIINPEHAKKMGAILAKLHQINLLFPELPFPKVHGHSNKYLASLSEKSLRAKLPFAQHLREKLDEVFLWNNMIKRHSSI